MCGGSIALLILRVYHRVQITEYASVLTYRQLALCTKLEDLADPISSPLITRFVVRSGELLNFEYGRYAMGAEIPIRISLVMYEYVSNTLTAVPKFSRATRWSATCHT